MPSLKYNELARDLKAGIRPVYLVHGDEPFLIEDALDKIISAAQTGSLAEFNGDVFRARESTVNDVLTSCQTLPMMADRRVVVVKELNGWKASEQEALVPYLENPSPSTCLILISLLRLDARNKLCVAARKHGAVIEARHLYGRELMAQVHKLAKNRGKRLDSDAASLLLELAGSDLQSLKMQIEKLSLYTGDKKGITRDDVAEAVADIKLFTIFEFTDALGNKNLEAALHSFRRMLELGETPVMILSMVARHFRILFRLKEDQEKGMPLDGTAKLFRLPPGILRNYLPQTKKFAWQELARIWKMLANLDYLLKSSAAARELIFEQKIVELCRA